MNDKNIDNAENPRSMEVEINDASLTIAKNISAARTALNMSQDDLAVASGVSRATLIQIEGGQSDPLLSTVVKLAWALHVSPMFLLLREQEFHAIASVANSQTFQNVQKNINEEQINAMNRLLQSGMTRNRNKAAKMGGEVVRAAFLAPLALIPGAMGVVALAAIGSILIPGIGTALGAALGTPRVSSKDENEIKK